jgi:hypothetical protein
MALRTTAVLDWPCGCDFAISCWLFPCMKVPNPASNFRRCPTQRLPFVFSYDISSSTQARAVRRYLRRWRMDGQLSVHETISRHLGDNT